MEYSIEGLPVAPGAGIEVGGPNGFFRATVDYRYPISDNGGHGGAVSIGIGREL